MKKLLLAALLLTGCGTDSKKAGPDANRLCSDYPTCGVLVKNGTTCSGNDNGQPCTCICP